MVIGWLSAVILSACMGSQRVYTSATDVPPPVISYLDTADLQEANRLFEQLLNYPVPVLLEALKSSRSYPAVSTGHLPSQIIRVNGELRRYGLYIPPNYDSTRAFPLIICLHGAGFDGDSYLDRWQPRLGDRYILACPTFVFGAWWTKEAEELVLSVIKAVIKKYHVDPDRVFLTGMSNGAIGTYLIGLNHADLFAALIPMAGALPDPLLPLLDNAQTTPFYLIHGAKDEVIPSRYSQTVLDYLLKRGYSVVYREHHWEHPMAGGHYFPKEELPALIDWLEKKRRVALPKTITIVKDRDHAGRAYWIRIEEIDPEAGSFWASESDPGETQRLKEGKYGRIEARIPSKNLLEIKTRRVRRFTVLLNDFLVDLNRPVRIVTNGKVSFDGMVVKDASILLEEARRRPDPNALITAAIEIAVED
jgi:predicted esterase